MRGCGPVYDADYGHNSCRRWECFHGKKISYETLDLPCHKSRSNQERLCEAQIYYDRMKRRHSVWYFNGQLVPEAIIQSCIRSAGTAPSGANHQPRHFVAISDPEIKHQIQVAAEKKRKKCMRVEVALNGWKHSNVSEPTRTSHIWPLRLGWPWFLRSGGAFWRWHQIKELPCSRKCRHCNRLSHFSAASRGTSGFDPYAKPDEVFK